MSKKIYKYILDFSNCNNLQMPINAKILSVQNQNGFICLWAEVDTTLDKINHCFHIIGTGYSPPENSDYIGTIQENIFVWHIYKER